MLPLTSYTCRKRVDNALPPPYRLGMPSSTPSRKVLMLLGALWATAIAGEAAPAGAQVEKPATALAAVHPDVGFIDDGYALTPDGRVLLYVNTDGASWA